MINQLLKMMHRIGSATASVYDSAAGISQMHVFMTKMTKCPTRELMSSANASMPVYVGVRR